MNKPKHANPVWETVVMFASFVLLWVWFLANQSARQTPGGGLSPLWQVGLAVVLLVLVAITVRRMNRVKRLFSGEDENESADENSPPVGLPPYPPHPGNR